VFKAAKMESHLECWLVQIVVLVGQHAQSTGRHQHGDVAAERNTKPAKNEHPQAVTVREYNDVVAVILHFHSFGMALADVCNEAVEALRDLLRRLASRAPVARDLERRPQILLLAILVDLRRRPALILAIVPLARPIVERYAMTRNLPLLVVQEQIHCFPRAEARGAKDFPHIPGVNQSAVADANAPVGSYHLRTFDDQGKVRCARVKALLRPLGLAVADDNHSRGAHQIRWLWAVWSTVRI